MKMTLEEWKSKPRIGAFVFTYNAETKQWESGDDELRVTVTIAMHGSVQGPWFACLRSGDARYIGSGYTPTEALDRAARDLGMDAARAVKWSRLIVRETEKEMF